MRDKSRERPGPSENQATLKPGNRKPETGNRKPESENEIRNPQSGIRNPESAIRNPEFTNQRKQVIQVRENYFA